MVEHRSLKALYPSDGGSLGSSPSGAAAVILVPLRGVAILTKYQIKKIKAGRYVI